MRRFPAPGLPGAGGRITLDAEASHHLLRVTGVAPGEVVELFDGQGAAAAATLEGTDGQGHAVLVQQGGTRVAELPERWLLVGLCKHAAMDTIVRMATELGATRIQPVRLARSVAKGDRCARWDRIIQGAARQCGRADLPELAAPMELAEALATVPTAFDRRVLSPGAPHAAPPRPPCAVLIGPEGGLTPTEVTTAQAAGFSAEGLSGHVLRADTAAAIVLGRTL